MNLCEKNIFRKCTYPSFLTHHIPNFKKQYLLMTYSSGIELLLHMYKLLCSVPWVMKGKQEEQL